MPWLRAALSTVETAGGFEAQAASARLTTREAANGTGRRRLIIWYSNRGSMRKSSGRSLSTLDPVGKIRDRGGEVERAVPLHDRPVIAVGHQGRPGGAAGLDQAGIDRRLRQGPAVGPLDAERSPWVDGLQHLAAQQRRIEARRQHDRPAPGIFGLPAEAR